MSLVYSIIAKKYLYDKTFYLFFYKKIYKVQNNISSTRKVRQNPYKIKKHLAINEMLNFYF